MMHFGLGADLASKPDPHLVVVRTYCVASKNGGFCEDWRSAGCHHPSFRIFPERVTYSFVAAQLRPASNFDLRIDILNILFLYENMKSNLTDAELLVLGLVAEMPRHGYQLEQVIEQRGMREWTRIGFSSIYFVLGKLEMMGLFAAKKTGRGQSKENFHDDGCWAFGPEGAIPLSTQRNSSDFFQRSIGDGSLASVGAERSTGGT
jgi:hypothetical protein